MKKQFKINPFLSLGLLLFGLAVFSEYIALPIYQNWLLQQKPQQVEALIHEKEKAIEGVFDDLTKNQPNKNLSKQFNTLTQRAHEKGFKLYVYKNRQLVFWSDNKTLPRVRPIKSGKISLNKLGNGYYLQKNEYQDQRLFTALIPVKNNYAIRNQYLGNDITLTKNLDNYFKLKQNQKKGSPIYSETGNYLFSLKPKTNLPDHDWPIWVYLAGFFLLIISLTKQLNHWLFQKEYFKGVFTFSLVSLFLYLDIIWFRWPESVFRQPFFDQALFSDIPPIGSLGSFVIGLMGITILVHYINKYWQIPFKILGNFRYLSLPTFFILTMLLSHFTVIILRLLILKSEIHWDIKELNNLTFLSLVGVLTVFLIFYNLVLLTSWFYRHVKGLLVNHFNTFFILNVGLVFVYHALSEFFGFKNYWAGIFALGLWLGLWVWRPRKPYVNGPLAFFVLWCSLFTAYHLVQFTQEKELNKKKFLATRVTYQRDLVAEHLLKNVSREIKQDKYINNFFFNPILSKNFLTKRIKELYFSRYLNKYDLRVHTYKYGGVPYKSQDSKPMSYFEKLINKYGLKTPGKNLHFINKTGSNPTYLALYNFNLLNNVEGTLVIELKKKVFHEESIYPELLIEENLKNKSPLADYSHAIYKNNRLISQKGDYPYPVSTDIENQDKVFYKFFDKGYSHLFHQVSHNTFTIISKKPPGTLHQLSVFSILFIAFFIFSGLLILLQKRSYYSLKRITISFKDFLQGRVPLLKQLLFQQKIQFTILVLVLLVMFAVGVSTVNYLRFDYNQQLNNQLSDKIKQILPILEEELQSQNQKVYDNEEKLFATVKNLSNRYQVDINIFDLNGFLVTSSHPRVYQKNIQANLMEANAYHRMRIDKRSQLIHNEKIGDLSYLAAYAPIRNAQNQIIGFLNLPYFSKESKLRNEISSLVITLLDLYVLIFLIVILVSLSISNTLTKPLNLIREKLKKTQLGQRNEPIEWESRDELGQLITEYNAMIDALDENAKALAKSEREGAWREMARQVAHEIKNPLTPMKLNIQRLESEFETNNDPRAEDVRKVSKILINQIDHLSKIATDFSAFAQISLSEPSLVKIEGFLQDQKAFFDTHDPNLTFVLDLKTVNSSIWIDKNHFNRIITNMMKNAQEAIPNDRMGEVIMGTRERSDNHILIWIQDNGKGIPKEKRESIFQPNFSTKNSGTGLGLAMVKKMVERAEGEIWFESTEGIGTTFYMVFPKVKDS